MVTLPSLAFLSLTRADTIILLLGGGGGGGEIALEVAFILHLFCFILIVLVLSTHCWPILHITGATIAHPWYFQGFLGCFECGHSIDRADGPSRGHSHAESGHTSSNSEPPRSPTSYSDRAYTTTTHDRSVVSDSAASLAVLAATAAASNPLTSTPPAE